MRKAIGVIIVGLISVIVVVFSGACLKEPQGPTKWDIHLAAPLVRDSVLFSDFDINFDSSFTTFYDSMGILTVSFSDSMPPESLADLVDIPEIHDSAIINIGEAIITDIDTSNIKFSIINIVPSTIAPFIPDSGIAVIPSFSNVISALDTITEIHWASLRGSRVFLSVKNFVPVMFDSLMVNLFNSRGQQIISFKFFSLGYNGEYDTTISVGQLWIDSIINYDIRVYSSGSGGDSVLVTRRDSMVIEFALDSLCVDSMAVSGGKITGEKSTHETFYVEHNILVDTVAFSNGVLRLNIFNYLSFPVSMMMNIPEFSFDTTLFMPENSLCNVVIDLSDHPYVRLDPDSNSISAEVRLDSDIPSDSVFILRSRDSLGVHADILDARFSHASVTFSELYTDTLPEDTVNLGDFDIPEGIDIEHVMLNIQLVSSLFFQPMINLTFVGYRDDGDSIVFPIRSFRLNPGTPFAPETTDLTVDIAPLINFRPNLITMKGTIEIDGSGSIYENSSFNAKYGVRVPLILNIEADTLYSDTFELNLDDDFVDMLLDSSILKEVCVILNVRNRFPFGFNELKLVLMDTTRGDSMVLPLRGTFPPAPVDPFGIPIADTIFADTILIDSAAANFLGRANKGYGVISWNPVERAALFRDSKMEYRAYGFIKARMDAGKLAGGEE